MFARARSNRKNYLRLSSKKRLDYALGGIGIFALRPLTALLGAVLRRDHSPVVKNRAAIVKMLGGGSLVIALPALVGLRRSYSEARLSLVTTNLVKPFAEVLGVFDEILVIDDASFIELLLSSMRVLWNLFRIDTVLDLEVYSRLSTVFTTLTCARNRIGFYLESTFWRERLATHLIFFNRFAGSFNFYEFAVASVGATPASLLECARHVALANGIEIHETPQENCRVTKLQSPGRICLAPACSEFGRERMLSNHQWGRILSRLVRDANEVVILGGPADADVADSLIHHAQSLISGIAWLNACDGRPLVESLRLLAGCSRLVAINSSLLHFARLFGVPTVSFWGPTSPMTRLKNSPTATEEVCYEKLRCSPCMHVAETPPCFGRNLCMEAAVRRFCGEDFEPIVALSHPPPFARLARE